MPGKWMLLVRCSVLSALCMTIPSVASLFAQGGAKVIQEESHDQSAALTEMSASPAAGGREPRQIPLHQFLFPAHRGLSDPVVQSLTGALVSTTSPSATGGLGANGVAPPDTNGAVGASQFVLWVNAEFAVYDKTTGAKVYGPVAGNTLWSGFGGPCETTNDGDPIAQYDKAANRWVMSQLANVSFGPPFYQCIAVSTTSDATGSYHRYAFSFSNLNDYPKLAPWPDGYYFSANMFQKQSSGALNFVGPEACVFNRTAMLAGSTATAQCFQLTNFYYSLLPSDLDGSTAPPSGSPDFYMSLQLPGSNTLDFWKFHVDWTTPSNSTFTGPTAMTVAGFTEGCDGSPNGLTCIPQRGTTQQLDSLSDRLMYRLAYRNFGDHEALVVNHSVDAGSAVGVRWYEIRNPSGTPVIYQQGTYAPADGNYRWMGSIAMDKAGDIALGYSVSSANMYPAIRYTGRVADTAIDPLGTMEAEASIIEGTGSQTTNLSRWGDYTSMSMDPVDDCTFWYVDEYIPTSGTFNWSTQIAWFKFSSCGGPSAPSAPAGLVATAGNGQVSLAWSASSGASSYNVLRSGASGGPYTQIASSLASNSYTNTGLTNGQTYYYVVEAVNSVGVSPYSNQASATPAAPTLPSAPTGLAASAARRKVNLKWTQSTSSGVTQNKVYRSTTSGGPYTLLATISATTAFSDTSVSSGRTYYYVVTAVTSAGQSGFSNQASATPR
jgi:fibronectin type III domain protein